MSPEAMRDLMDLVTVEEAKGHQNSPSVRDLLGLLRRYADTVVVMDAERKRAEETIRSLVVGQGRLAAQLDDLAALKVKELDAAIARAEAAEAGLASVQRVLAGQFPAKGST